MCEKRSNFERVSGEDIYDFCFNTDVQCDVIYLIETVENLNGLPMLYFCLAIENTFD